jgi:hypothetical protein
MRYPSYIFDYLNNVYWTAQIMKLMNKRYSPFSCLFLSLTFNIFLRHPQFIYSIMNTVCWDVTPCILIYHYWLFWGTWCFCFHSSTLQMEAEFHPRNIGFSLPVYTTSQPQKPTLFIVTAMRTSVLAYQNHARCGSGNLLQRQWNPVQIHYMVIHIQH